MFLMAEKGIRGGMCNAIHRYAEANNNYMKNYDKNKESSYIQYLISQKLPKLCCSYKIIELKKALDHGLILKKFIE